MKNSLIPPSPISTSTNYRLSLDLKILGKVSGWSNIIHFTRYNNHGHFNMALKSRTPAIFVYPNSTNLHFVQGNTGNVNQNTGDPVLKNNPYNLWINFKFEITQNGNKVKILKNNQVVTQYNNVGDFYGDNNIYVWISSPWYPAANVKLKNVKYERLPNPFSL